MSKSTKTIAKNLRGKLEKWGAKTRLAEITGIHASTIDGYLNEKTITVDQLDRLAEGLGCSTASLLTDDETSALPKPNPIEIHMTPEVEAVIHLATEYAVKEALQAMSKATVPVELDRVPADILEALKEFQTEADFEKLRLAIEANRRNKARKKPKEDHQASRTKSKSTA